MVDAVPRAGLAEAPIDYGAGAERDLGLDHGLVTEDGLLGGRLRMIQPRRGLRIAIDAVLLAAAVPATGGEAVIEPGTGVGAAALCLAQRVGGCRVVGLELELPLAALAVANAAANGMADRVMALAGDIGMPPGVLRPGSFDHAMMNPPYLPAGPDGGTARTDKSAATVEGPHGLGDWVHNALSLVRPRGSLTVIHRADRLGALLAALDGVAGDTVVFPLWPSAGKAAKRVIVRSRKGAHGPLRLAPGLVLHDGAGHFTAAAEAVLREGAGLTLD